ncbi:MAG TPA: hypothetical protein VIX89_19695 [Bryobacteraceae bacterium]
MSNDVQVHPEKSAPGGLFYPDHRIQLLCTRENIPVVVLAEAMAAYAKQNSVFLHGFTPPGFGHWNENGHRVAGELIADRLCREIPMTTRAIF